MSSWVTRWLNRERFTPYLRAAGGDEQLALRLYEWNACLSAALLHDLGHLEVGLRNAYDRALRASGPVPWTEERSPLFAPVYRGAVDINARIRIELEVARRRARETASRPAAHNDVVAGLGFGFWRSLGSKGHEKTLWVPYLHTAFPAGTVRARDVDDPLRHLHMLRNRVAHHESLLRVDVSWHAAEIVRLAARLDPELGRYVAAMSTVGRHVARRPAA